MLDSFSDLAMTGVEEQLTDSRFSIKTQEGVAVDTYDFQMSINDPDKGFLGFEATDLRVVGSASIRDTAFGYEVPISLLRVEVEMVGEDQEEVLRVNPAAQKPSVKEFRLDLGTVSLGDDFPKDTQEEYDSVQSLLKSQIEAGIKSTYEDIWEGDLDKIANMPVESFLPMLALRHIGSFSKEFSLGPQNIEFGFDPEMYFERLRETPKKKKGLLKAIDSEFTPAEEGEDPKLF